MKTKRDSPKTVEVAKKGIIKRLVREEQAAMEYEAQLRSQCACSLFAWVRTCVGTYVRGYVRSRE